MDLWIIFLTGLSVGGLSCAAVQGGLLASVVVVQSKSVLKPSLYSRVFPTIVFLLAKLIVYILLGFLLGALGEKISFSSTQRAFMQAIAGVYMVGIALSLLDIHPIFRRLYIQPPRFLRRIIHSESKSASVFAPFFLGLMTVFIPCGVTLAMEALAITTGNPFSGAVLLGIFTLGTVPLFLGIGWLVGTLGRFKSGFLKIAALVIMYLGLSSINGSLVLVGLPLSFNNVTQGVQSMLGLVLDPTRPVSGREVLGARVENGVQVVDISVHPNGYKPNKIRVGVGLPVRINLTSTGAMGCTSTFVVPKLNIVKNIAFGESNVVEFTPDKVGNIAFSCSMGMYGGIIEVI